MPSIDDLFLAPTPVDQSTTMIPVMVTDPVTLERHLKRISPAALMVAYQLTAARLDEFVALDGFGYLHIKPDLSLEVVANPGTGDFDPLGAADAAVAAHVAIPDPHTQYLNTVRGDARYDPLGAASIVAAALSSHTITNNYDPHTRLQRKQVRGAGLQIDANHEIGVANVALGQFFRVERISLYGASAVPGAAVRVDAWSRSVGTGTLLVPSTAISTMTGSTVLIDLPIEAAALAKAFDASTDGIQLRVTVGDGSPTLIRFAFEFTNL